MRDQVFERSVFDDQFTRAFLADARHAFDVVDRVAHQREDIDDLLGRDAEFLAHAGRVIPRTFVPRVEDAEAVVHELEEVLVHRHDRDVESGCSSLGRQRSDDIVGFEPLGVENRNAKRFAGGVHDGNLHSELVGHRRAIGFVVLHEIVAERPAGEVEGSGDVFRFVVGDQLPEHRDEDVDGVGRHSRGVAQHAAVRRSNRRMKGPIHLRTAVDEVEERLGGHLTLTTYEPRRPREILYYITWDDAN